MTPPRVMRGHPASGNCDPCGCQVSFLVWYLKLDLVMDTFHVRVVEGGKIVLPAALRRKHGFAVGDTLVVEDTSDGVKVRSLREAIAAVQALVASFVPEGVSLSDELIV